MTAADRVARPREVFDEIIVSLRGSRRGESQHTHRLVVQDRNRLVNRVVGGGQWNLARETDGSCDIGRRLRIVKGVRESRSPDLSYQSPENRAEGKLPVAKITGDNAKRVLPREERCNNVPEPNFRLAI